MSCLLILLNYSHPEKLDKLKYIILYYVYLIMIFKEIRSVWFGLVLWHNICSLFNAKSIFM